MISEDGVHGIGSLHIQDATIQSCDVGIKTFPINNQTGQGSTAILLDNVAFDGVKTPVIDSEGTVLLSSSGSFQVDIWSIGSQYAFGDTWEDGETATQYNLGDQEISFGSHIKSSRVKQLESDPSGSGFSSTWYSYQRKPQYGDEDVNGIINVKDYGAKGKFGNVRRYIPAVTLTTRPGDGKTDDTTAFKSVFGYGK